MTRAGGELSLSLGSRWGSVARPEASFLSERVDSLWSKDKQLQAVPGQEQPVLSIKKSQFPWIKQEEQGESRQMS